MSENENTVEEQSTEQPEQPEQPNELEEVLNFSRGLMNRFGIGESQKSDVPDAEPSKEHAEHTEESESEDSPETPEEGVENDSDEESEDVEKSELNLLREQNKALLKQLEEISSKIFNKPDEQREQEKPETSLELVSDEDFEELFSSKDNLNKVLNNTMQKTLSYVVRDLPQVISNEVMKTVQLQNTIQGFYSENPDLIEHSQYLGHISTEIAQKEPDLTLQENLAKTAEEFRRRTGMNGKKKNPAPKTKPSNKKLKEEIPQAPAGTARTSVGTQTQKESMQDEIQKVLAFARGPFG